MELMCKIMHFNFNEIGIDKLILKSLNPTIINFNKLLSNKNVRIIETYYKRNFYIDGSLKEIGELEIHDSIFFLRIGIKKIGANLIEYEKLEINPAKIIHGINVNNINKISYFNIIISILEAKLYDYGLEVSINSSTIKEMELNTNLKLNYNFTEYKQCLDLITDSLPYKFKKISNYRNNELGQYTGFKAENEQISLKFYNKDLERNLDLPYNILRIEYRFKNSRKIKSAFSYDSLYDLLSNLNDIKTIFNKLIEKDIINPIRKKIKQLLKYNYNSLTTLKQNKRYYIQQFCAETQDDTNFDYELICNAINSLNINRGNKYKRKQELKQELLKREGSGTKTFFNNISKLNEIIVGLGYEKLNL